MGWCCPNPRCKRLHPPKWNPKLPRLPVTHMSYRSPTRTLSGLNPLDRMGYRAAGVLFVRKDGSVLMCIEPYDKHLKLKVNLLGGKIEVKDKHNALSTATRELSEETCRVIDPNTARALIRHGKGPKSDVVFVGQSKYILFVVPIQDDKDADGWVPAFHLARAALSAKAKVEQHAEAVAIHWTPWDILKMPHGCVELDLRGKSRTIRFSNFVQTLAQDAVLDAAVRNVITQLNTYDS